MVGTKPILGVAELVWNALDADATDVDVAVVLSEAGAVEEVVVSDNGHGFRADEVQDLFSQVGGSWKKDRPYRKTRGGRLLHGEKGEGRWRAFSVGDRVTWESTAKAESGDHHETVRVVMSAQRLNEYDWDSLGVAENPTGTLVRVVAGMKEPNTLQSDAAPNDLAGVLALYLTKYPNVRVVFDGEDIRPERLIHKVEEIPVPVETPYGAVTLTVIEWSRRMDRALYLCDESGATLHEAEARIQAPGFDFTAYISWAGFRIHESLLPLADLDSQDLGPVLDAARSALRQYFRDRRRETEKSLVEEWKQEDVYPWSEEPTDDVGKATQALFNYVAVTAAQAVNTISEPAPKKMVLQTMRIAVEHDPSSLEVVLREVLALPEEKLEEFRSLLERTPLVHFVDALRAITGRLEFVHALEHLLFDPETSALVLERQHLQKILESEPWIFGEEFALHVSDRSLTAVLQAHLKVLGRDDLVDAPVLDAEAKDRRVDFLFGRALEHTRNRREHLVVEIKRPGTTLTRKEVAQIEDYAEAVSLDSRFDRATTDWDFVLVSTDMDSKVTARANTEGLPPGLIGNEKDSNVRIWVRNWSEIIGDARHRLKFVKAQLDYDPDDDQAMTYLRDNYPDYLPAHLLEEEANDE